MNATQKIEMVKDILDRKGNRNEYQNSAILSIGRKYVHFISLYEGSKKQKVTIDYFIENKSLYGEE